MKRYGTARRGIRRPKVPTLGGGPRALPPAFKALNLKYCARPEPASGEDTQFGAWLLQAPSRIKTSAFSVFDRIETGL